MSIFDSHAHLTCQDLVSKKDELVQNAKEVGIKNIVNICTDRFSMSKGLELVQKYPHIFNAGSTTPHDVCALGTKDFPFFEEQAKNNQLIAIGETGLDYYYEHSDKNTQQDFLIRYLDLATRTNLPVIIHCRDAFDDLFSICDQNYSGPLVFHCFTGTKEEAKKVLERGWMLSLSGIVTFKKCVELKEIAKFVPLNQLFIETDAPYLAPGKYRGKQNQPAYITETVKEIACLKQVDEQIIIDSTYQNARSFFNIS